MDIALEKASDTNASLKITLKPDDYKPAVSKKLKEYGRQVSVKGFRPGHVPPALVQKMYGKGVLIDEINSILSKSVSGYIRDNKLQVVGDPLPDRTEADAVDWDNQEEFSFTYNLGLASDFEVDMSALPPVTQYDIQAGDTEIDKTIDDLRQRFHNHEHAEEAIEGDTLFGELSEIADDDTTPFTTKTALPLNKVATDYLHAFIGRKKGETFSFDMESAFPDVKDRALATGAKPEEAENLKGEFSFTLEDVTRHVPAELNQEFFDKVLGLGKVDNEADFRAQVKEIIQGNYARESSNLLKYDIDKALLDNVQINLPDEFLKNWLLESNEGKFTPDQIDEQYPDFTKSVKLQLIKNKLAEQTEINVDFNEVMEVTRQMVREQFGFTDAGNDEMNQTIDRIARNYLMDEKNNGRNFMDTQSRVFDEKVTDYIKSQLTVQPQSVTLDEFRERAQAANQ